MNSEINWFFEIPNEIVYLIIEYLDIRHSIRFLRTCRALHNFYTTDERLRLIINEKEFDPSYGSLTEILESEMDFDKMIASIGRAKMTNKDINRLSNTPWYIQKKKQYNLVFR